MKYFLISLTLILISINVFASTCQEIIKFQTSIYNGSTVIEYALQKIMDIYLTPIEELPEYINASPQSKSYIKSKIKKNRFMGPYSEFTLSIEIMEIISQLPISQKDLEQIEIVYVFPTRVSKIPSPDWAAIEKEGDHRVYQGEKPFTGILALKLKESDKIYSLSKLHSALIYRPQDFLSIDIVNNESSIRSHLNISSFSSQKIVIIKTHAKRFVDYISNLKLPEYTDLNRPVETSSPNLYSKIGLPTRSMRGATEQNITRTGYLHLMTRALRLLSTKFKGKFPEGETWFEVEDRK